MSGVCSEVPFNVRKLLQVWTLVVAFTPTMSGYTWSANAKSAPDHNFGPSPVFDDFTIRNVEASEGQTLLLPCTVRNLGDKVVSWIRSRDLHILTSGPFTFSSDNRFEAVASQGGQFWGLRIRGVYLSDAGRYECQVNTDPKISLNFNLTVSGARKMAATDSKWVGRALIKGPGEVYVGDGSPVTFTCEISSLSVASPQSGVFMDAKPKVRWLHDNKELLFETSDRRISMESFFDQRSQKVTGILQISKASWRDSGQYTCLQMSVQPDSILLQVVENEQPEAMQRDFPAISLSSPVLPKLTLISTLVLCTINFST